MAAPSVLKVARTPTGYCIRIEGRGTMRESPAAAEFASKSLEAEGATLVVDLSACEHLDSTFLGCLVEMRRRASRASPSRFAVSAPEDRAKRLLGPTKLDLVLKPTAEPPQVVGNFVTMPAVDPASPDLMRHVMECHRLLADLGGPQQAAFAAIADNIERELGKGGGSAGKPAR
jgi:anti-anti-sigma regulatory factor